MQSIWKKKLKFFTVDKCVREFFWFNEKKNRSFLGNLENMFVLFIIQDETKKCFEKSVIRWKVKNVWYLLIYHIRREKNKFCFNVLNQR